MSSIKAQSYPKVLIVGESFHTKSGGGITQTNLFKNWPKENLAIIPYVKGTTDPLVCDRIFLLNENDILFRFPFNFIEKVSHNYPKAEAAVQNNAKRLAPRKKKNIVGIIKVIYKSLTRYFGFEHIKSKILVSSDLLKWIDEFKPEVIYAQFAELDKIRFVLNLRRETNLPLVIHFMDDWPSVLVSPGLFHNYWKRILDEDLKDLVCSSSACIAISEKMADVYGKRYNRYFSFFHNPVDIEAWLPYSKTNWEAGLSFRILYAGRTDDLIIKSIKTIAKCVQNLSSNNFVIEFHIFTRDFNEIGPLFTGMSSIFIHEPIPDYKQMPKLFSSYDVLLLPLNFKSRFLTLSMPTKVSEYMISGTPILIFAPKDTALAEYALREQWGLVIDTNMDKDIEGSILELYQNESIRRKYGQRAIEIAIANHDSNKVRSEFRQLLDSQVNTLKGLENDN